MIYDFCVIGGGIVGLATALALLERRPGAGLVLVEKEEELGRHQTGHNSGVIHSGIYYPPGSLKARLCREGSALMTAFCAEHGVPFETPGKLIVATDDAEAGRLSALHERSVRNRVEAERIPAADIPVLEPAIEGVAALLVPGSGIVDYRAVCAALARVIAGRGGEMRLGARAAAIEEGAEAVSVRLADGGTVRARKLVACAGLQSDRLARLAGLKVDVRIIPFRGEYFTLPEARATLVSRLIYPVPDPALPFLGVHLTPMIDASITVGPSAVLGFAREDLRRGALDLRDLGETLGFPGFWRMAGAHWRSGLGEMRNSLLKRFYLRQCRKYAPGLQLSDLGRYGAGIRAQAVRRDGSFVHDFLFADTGRMVHVLNAPSPGATSSIPIGRLIADRALGEGGAET